MAGGMGILISTAEIAGIIVPEFRWDISYCYNTGCPPFPGVTCYSTDAVALLEYR